MLDIHRDHVALLTGPDDARSAAPALPAAIRSLLNRLAGRTSPAAPEAEVPVDANANRAAVRRARLRAQAHAAFRCVEGPATAALDAALAVLESEIARPSDTAEAYGEALKAVRTYDDDAAQRAMAAAALYAFPVPLRAGAPIPQDRQRRHG